MEGVNRFRSEENTNSSYIYECGRWFVTACLPLLLVSVRDMLFILLDTTMNVVDLLSVHTVLSDSKCDKGRNAFALNKLALYVVFAFNVHM